MSADHSKESAFGKYFSAPQVYKGTVANENGVLIKAPEQIIESWAKAVAQIRKYVQDTVHPLLSAAKDVAWEGLNFKKNGVVLAPLKWLAGGTINVLESANRAVKWILDAGTGVYKNLVIDNTNSVVANTTDNFGQFWYWIGNTAKFAVSLPAYVTDFISNTWEKYGPSKWLQWASKKVANSGRELKQPRLVPKAANDNHANDNHGHWDAGHGHKAA